MMKVKTSSILTLLLFVFLGYTGLNSEPHQAEGATLENPHGIEILQNLLPQAAEIAGGVFNGSGWFQEDTTQTIPAEQQYALVTGEKAGNVLETGNVRSVAALKQAVETVYTKEAAQKLFYSKYLETKDDGLPLYKDYEGKLYVNQQNGGHGWATEFLYDTVKVKSQDGKTAELAIDTTVLDEPYGTLIVTIENVNGEWLMASGLEDYESIK